MKIVKSVVLGLKFMSDLLDLICRKICLLLGIVLVIDLFLGVFTRFVMNAPLSFTEEIARFCMLWFAFIGGSVELKKNNLISFSFIVDKLSPKSKKALEIVDHCLVILFLAVFLFVGKDALRIFGFAKASVTKMNLMWTAIGIYAGTAVMLIHSICQLLNRIGGEHWVEGKED